MYRSGAVSIYLRWYTRGCEQRRLPRQSWSLGITWFGCNEIRRQGISCLHVGKRCLVLRTCRYSHAARGRAFLHALVRTRVRVNRDKGVPERGFIHARSRKRGKRAGENLLEANARERERKTVPVGSYSTAFVLALLA